MFRRDILSISDVLTLYLRQNGLETPLLQHRLIEAWDTVAGPLAKRYTKSKYIRNDVLHVKITSPALRSELCMRRSELVKNLNAAVGTRIISDIHIY